MVTTLRSGILVSFSTLREENFELVINFKLLFSLLPLSGSILLIYPNPDLSAEEEIVHKIAEMSVKLQHIDSLNHQRKLDLQVGQTSLDLKLERVSFLAGHLHPVQLPAEAGEGPPGPVRGQQLAAQQETCGVQQTR